MWNFALIRQLLMNWASKSVAMEFALSAVEELLWILSVMD